MESFVDLLLCNKGAFANLRHAILKKDLLRFHYLTGLDTARVKLKCIFLYVFMHISYITDKL
jgi:hypothetical protein